MPYSPEVAEAIAYKEKMTESLNQRWREGKVFNKTLGREISYPESYELVVQQADQRFQEMSTRLNEILKPGQYILFVDMVERGTVGNFDFNFIDPERKRLAFLAQTGLEKVGVEEYQAETARHMLGFKPHDLRMRVIRPLKETVPNELSPGCVGILISGSEVNIKDDKNPNHIQGTEKVLKLIDYARSHGIPMNGICFGSQVLNYAFGSKVDWIKPSDTKYAESGLVRLSKTAAGRNHALLQDYPDENLVIASSHGQHVVGNIPKDLEILASSEESEVYIARLVRDHSIITVQGHPEVTSLIMDIAYDINGDRPQEDPELFQGTAENFSKTLTLHWLDLIKDSAITKAN